MSALRPVTEGNTLPQDLAAVLLVLAQLAAFTGCGQLGLSLLGWRPGPRIGPRLLVSVALGYGIFGLCVGVLGHLHLFRVWAVCGLLAIGVALAAGQREVRTALGRVPEWARAAWRADRIIVLLFLAVLAVFVLSAAAPPRQIDELSYHWASPLYWAAVHTLQASPYKDSNGVALAEIEYTVDAVFGLSTAAHLLDLSFMGLLTGTLALVLGRVGLPRIWAVLLVLSSPMILFEAPIAYSDIIFAALAMAALVALLYGPAPRRLLICAATIAVAASVKFLALLALPGFLWIDWREQAERGLRGASRRLRALGADTLWLAIPLAVVLAVWMLHSWLMVHTLFTSGDWYLTRANLGSSPGRIPSLADVLELPALWITVTLFGDRQPYGNRIGEVAIVFVPLTAWFWRRSSVQARSRLVLIGVPALLYLLADVVVARTRFNIYAWLLFGAAALVLPYEAATGGEGSGRLWMRWLLIAVTLAGLADGMRKIFFPHL